jgi:hypothetical protein
MHSRGMLGMQCDKVRRMDETRRARRPVGVDYAVGSSPRYGLITACQNNAGPETGESPKDLHIPTTLRNSESSPSIRPHI